MPPPPPHPVYKAVPREMAEPILHEGALVTLDVGAETTMLPCRVVGLTGDELALLPMRPPDAADLARAGPARHRPAALRDRRPPAGAARQRGRRAHGRLPRGDPHGRLPARPAAPALARPARLPRRADASPSTGTRGRRRRSTSAPRASASSAPDVAEPARAGTLALSLPDGEVVSQATLVTAAPDWLSYRLERIAQPDEPAARQPGAGLPPRAARGGSSGATDDPGRRRRRGGRAPARCRSPSASADSSR